MGAFNGNSNGNSNRDRNNGSNRGKRRLFMDTQIENLEERRMLDGSGVVTADFGDYYLYQNQKQSLLRSGTELVIQFTPGQKDTASMRLSMPGGPLSGFTKDFDLGTNGAAYKRQAIVGMSDADQVRNLVSIADQIRQMTGIQGAGPAFAYSGTNSSMIVLNDLFVGLKDGADPAKVFGGMDQVASWKLITGASSNYQVILKTNVGMETLQYAASIAGNASVRFSEPNAWVVRSLNALPNDPLLNLQWQNINTGQTGGTPGADVKVQGAWNRNVTGNNVVVAVLDSGVQTDHPDLAANIFNNTNEIPNDGIDNDNNGYIDDTNGWDFADGDNNPNPVMYSAADAHGTAVAGLSAGVGNNGIGIAGVAYTAKILPVRLPFNGEASSSTAFIEGVYYAAGLGANGQRVWRGADVINASYGHGGGPLQAEQDAWLAASTNGRNGLGSVCFASSGNGATDPNYQPGQPHYPSDYPGVIAVGGTDYNDQRVSYSQYGPRQSVMAPTGIGFENPASNTPNAYDLTTDVTGNQGFNPPDSGGFPPQWPTSQVSVDYTSFNGTSAASPMAAGVGALCVAANPTVTLSQIFDAIFSTTDQVGSVAYSTTASGPYGTYNGWNQEYGYGRVNAAAAVAKLQQFQVITTTPANGATVTTALPQLVVSFSAAVDMTTITSSDLIFSNLPTGVTVTVGTPTIYNNDPTKVAFPLTFNAAPTIRINGTFGYSIAADSIKSLTGRFIAAYSGNFNYNDLSGPQVTGVSIESRKVYATFSEQMRANTINLSSVQLYRANGTLNARNTLVTAVGDPRIAVSYDPISGKLTLDLTNLPQNLLPSDTYTLVLKDTIRDVAGNALDGEYNGTFPSGNGTEGGDFVYGLGYREVKAPKIIYTTLSAASDTGTTFDQNTSASRPTFVGQIQSDFPAAVSGVTVVAQYNVPNGTFDLDLGAGGRGWSGTPQIITTTNATGNFTLTYPASQSALDNGYYKLRTLVVGQSSDLVLPGLSSKMDQSFRIDLTHPVVKSSSVVNNSFVSALTNVSLEIVDPVLPSDPASPFAVPTLFDVPALMAKTATNISNYKLTNVGADGIFGTSDDLDASAYIKEVTYVNTSNRVTTSDPYTGKVSVNFVAGIPKATYVFQTTTSITDSAGNSLVPFSTTLNVNPVPVYITDFKMGNTAINPISNVAEFTPTGGPRSLFEIPNVNPTIPQAADAPPDTIQIDFSNSLDPASINNDVLQIFRSANSNLTSPDGDFKYFGTAGNTGGGYTRVTGLSISLVDSVPGCAIGSPGYRNRLVIQIPAGSQLQADNYRIIMPNNGSTAIKDVFGLQLDGEFLGNPVGTTSGTTNNIVDGKYDNALDTYETLMPTGQYRKGLSGDGTAGSAFVTGFTVVENGNILFTRADYNDDPFIPTDNPDGTYLKPYPTLLAEANPTGVNGGDLNSALNYGINFNPTYDRNGNGHFDPSAFFAAEVKSGALVLNPVTGQYEQATPNTPVAIIALASSSQYNPATGKVEQKTFVIQTPQGTTTEGSGSVPAMTTLVFDAGSAVKFLNTNLYVQTQGSAIQTRGGGQIGEQVIFTSYADDTVGGDANGDGIDTTPFQGDWGGVILRNFDDVNGGRSANPVQFPIDGTLGLSGADDVMSAFNFANIRYAGGAVPQTIGNRFNPLTLFNSRPSVTNVQISNSGSTGSSQAAIGADMDSFREDSNARGPLIRRTSLVGNSLNGIWLMPNVNGYSEPTNAMFYPNNPSYAGGAQNYTVDDPLPVVVISQVVVGERLDYSGGPGTPVTFTNRLYVQPGMMFKMSRGSWINAATANSSVNIGDRTYINEYDVNPNFGPQDPTFQPNTTGDAKAIFTSLYDDTASTFYFDPATGVKTTIVPAIDTDNGGNYLQPTPTSVNSQARWGAINIKNGVVAVIDEAQFQYGGGVLNTQSGTQPSMNVLNFNAGINLININNGNFNGNFNNSLLAGAYASVTNNDFFANQDAAIAADPNSFYAGDPTKPLVSGNPFFRGNVMKYNGIDGLAVLATVYYTTNGPVEGGVVGGSYYNLNVDSVWDDTDITYVVRGSIILAGWGGGFFNSGSNSKPNPDPNVLTQEIKPKQTFTIQSAVPDTLLADGSRIARPGESMLVKMLNDPYGPQPAGSIDGQGNDTNSTFAGAGFVVGRDNGIDPTADSTLDAGWGSQIRILGIGSNETTGQSRVPVIITSLRDSTVGKTVRGVTMNSILSPTLYAGLNPTTPAAGDGGVIYFGGLSQTDYNLFDPRGGNLVDNSDIRYMTRMEMQGGNVSDMVETDGAVGITIADNPLYQKLGLLLPGTNSPTLTQYNSANAMALSNSNFANFSQVGMVVHPGNDLLERTVSANGSGSFVTRVSGLKGQGNVLFAVNNTFANMQGGIRTLSETTDNATAQNPMTIMALNNTFYNTNIGLYSTAPAYNGLNSNSHVYMYAMDNIFSNCSQYAVQQIGQNYGSEGQYNLYYSNAQNTSGFYDVSGVFGNPLFRNAAGLDFTLLPGSAAIDIARSEVGPLPMGNALAPISTQVLAGNIGGIRNQTGRISSRGGFGTYLAVDIVTLPGYQYRSYYDQFIPIVSGTPVSYNGTASNSATWSYTPISGERDQNGYLRQDDPSTPNVGFGSRPFFDSGAYEYRKLFGPQVTAVTALLPGGTTPVNIYKPLGVAGTNKSPESISFTLNARLDPLTITSKTIILQASGGDGVFGNANSTSDRTIDLSGKLAYDPVTKQITVNMATSNLLLTNDLYRIILVGEGATVIRDQRGNPLDGENLDASGAQLPLPSGDGFPGGSFQVTFSVDTNPPKIVAGSFQLVAASDTGQPGDQITRASTPDFTGAVYDVPPPTNPLLNQTVSLSVSTLGNGVYDLPNVGTTQTNAQGIFIVKPNQPLNETKYNVGPDGILGTPDDTNYSVAKVSATDQSGNVSNPNDRNAQLKFVVDTQGPRITSANPAPSSQVTATNVLPVTLGVNENVNPATLTTSSIIVVRSGGDGVFGNANDVKMTIDPASIKVDYLKIDAQGSINVSFNINGPSFPNDLYRVTLVGAGASAVTDRAGNPLNGQFNGTFPSGVKTYNGTGTDFVMYYTILDTSKFVTRYVSTSGGTGTGAVGSRNNPYPSITSAINAAQIGDTVAVLPGTYNENVVLKSLVQLVSASTSSTNTILYPGIAKETIIRPAFGATNVITVTGSGLISTDVAPTRLSGFTLASPLVGNETAGTIDPKSVALSLTNSLINVDRIYVMNAGTGIQINTSGNSAPTPLISNAVIVGNTNGVVISDGGTTDSLLRPIVLTNNTIAFNDNGVVVNVAGTSPVDFVQIVNTILSGNASLTTPRTGYAVSSTTLDRVTLRFNNFFNNGVSATNYADDTINIGNGFDPAALNNGRDALGNVPGDPAFVYPVDPRPNADGPLKFFTDANYDLRKTSVAIDAAQNSSAPTYDFLYRARVTIAGKGYPGTGPADIGAFEYNGTATSPSTPINVPTASGSSTGSNAGPNSGGTGNGTSSGSGTGTTITTNPAPKPAPAPAPKVTPKPVVKKPVPKPVVKKPVVKAPVKAPVKAVKKVG